MNGCSFDLLVRYLDKELDLDARIELLEHLDVCENCRETMYLLSRDRDASFFQFRPYKVDKVLAR